MKPCWLCPSDKKEEAVESHHLAPVEWGGAMDGEQVPLCESCHGKVHRLANKVSSGNLPLSNIPPWSDPVQHQRWHKAILAIVNQKAQFQATGLAPDARRRIAASLTEKEQQYVHLIRDFYGFSSIEKMLKALITREAVRISTGKAVRRKK